MGKGAKIVLILTIINLSLAIILSIISILDKIM
jgi:hypothetical protein